MFKEAKDSDVESANSIDTLLEASIFRAVDRMKLIASIISFTGPGGCGLDINQLEKDQCESSADF